MTRIIGGNRDYNHNLILNAAIQPLAAPPSSPVTGQIYYDTGLHQLGVYNGATWDYATIGTSYSDEQAQDAVAAAFTNGTQAGVTVTYNDPSNSLSISVVNDEALQDAVGAFLGVGTGNSGVTVTYNDASNRMEFTIGAGAITGAMIADGSITGGTAGGGVKIAAATITNANIAAGAAIAYSKLALSAGVVNADISGTAAIAYAKLALTNSIVNADVAAAAAIAYSKLNLATSIVNGDIAAGAAIAYSKLALTGSIVNADIAGAAAIAYSKLNLATSIVNGDISAGAAIAYSKIAVPTADISIGGFKITNVAVAIAGTDVPNLQQVQDLINTGTNKSAARVATTGNIATLAGGAPSTLDGVTLAANDRVLVKDQTTGSQNGLYIVTTVGTGVNGTWTRATDADISAEVKGGLSVWVNEGTVNADTRWVLTTNDPLTLGTTALVFVQDFAVNSTTAGAGLVANGRNLDVNPGNGIVITSDAVTADPAVVVRKFAQTIVGTSATEVITHNLNTQDVWVNLYKAASTFDEIDPPDIQHTSVNTITLLWPSAPGAGAYRVVVHG